MGAFFNIAQGIGRMGSEVGEAKTAQKEEQRKTVEDQLRSLQMRMQYETLQEKLRAAKLPESLGTFSAPDGSVRAIMRDPNTGALTTQALYQPDMSGMKKDLEGIVAQVPQDKQQLVRALVQPAVDMGDYAQAVKIASTVAEKITGERPVTAVEQMIQTVARELKKNPEQLTSEELKKAIENATPYGGQKVQIQREGLALRSEEAIFKDVEAIAKRLEPLDTMKRLMDEALPSVTTPTGEGDVKLVSAFVAATKPPVGFRWTQQEINMIRNATGIANRFLAAWKRLGSGTMLAPEQRKQIGETVQHLSEYLDNKRKHYIAAQVKDRPDLKAHIEELEPETPPVQQLDLPPGFVIESMPKQ